MPVASLFLNEHHLALVARHESKGVLLTIWDRDTMTLLAEEKLDRSDPDNGLMITNGDSHLRSCFSTDHQEEFLIRNISTILGHRLVIASGNMAIVHSIHYPAKSSLLQLIGKSIKGKEAYLEAASRYASDISASELKLMKKLRHCPDDLDTFISIYTRFLGDSSNPPAHHETIHQPLSETNTSTRIHDRSRNSTVSISIRYKRIIGNK